MPTFLGIGCQRPSGGHLRPQLFKLGYASDDGGESTVPLDAKCGMTDRYLTPEVEEMVTFASAATTPNEVKQLMAKALPLAPSETAIKRGIGDVGSFFDEHREAIEERIVVEEPLSDEGATLVVSWDGVMVPVRGEEETTWKEAGAGRISIYGDPSEEDGAPPLLDSRYLARMPETGMATLIEQIAAQVAGLRERQHFDHFAIICDGKDSIWRTAESRPEFDGAVLILDFYHATSTLSGAADAIFGQETPEARLWYEKRREQLLLDPRGIDNLLRALKRYSKMLRGHATRHNVVRRAIKHFTKKTGSG